MPSNNQKNKNNKKKKASHRPHVDVKHTQASSALLSRRKELERKLQNQKNTNNTMTDNDSDSNHSNTANTNVNTNMRTESIDIIEENDEKDDEKMDKLFDACPLAFTAEEEWEMLDDLDITAQNLVYILQQEVSVCIPLLNGIKDCNWSIGQVLTLKQNYDRLYPKLLNEPKHIKNKNTHSKSELGASDSESEMDSTPKKKSKNKNRKKEMTFEFEWDSKNPDYRQFMALYKHPNKYERIKLLGRVYWDKRYLLLIELIYLISDNNKAIESNKTKNKIYGRNSFDKSGVTFFFRQTNWMAMCYDLNGYIKLTDSAKKFRKLDLQRSLVKFLAGIYSKNKNRKERYRFSFDKKFVEDAFLAIGNGWKILEQCENKLKNHNKGKKRGRKRK